MKNYLLISFLLVVSLSAYSQIGINTENPDSCAVLDISVGNDLGGLLIPRISNSERLNIPKPIKSLLIFNTSNDYFMSFYADDIWQVLNPWRMDFGKSGPRDTVYTENNVSVSKNISANTVNANHFKGENDTATFEGFGTVPLGGIIMWSGNKVPNGWKLCDGKDGRPDLRGRFIVGYDERTKDYDDHSGPEYHTIRGEGGEKAVLLNDDNLPTHTHKIEDPGHNHNNGVYMYLLKSDGEATISSKGMDKSSYEPRLNAQGVIQSAKTGIKIGKTGGVFTPGKTEIDYSGSPDQYIIIKECLTDCIDGGGTNCEDNCTILNPDYNPNYGKEIEVEPDKWDVLAHENRPPYYVLAFIIRVK